MSTAWTEDERRPRNDRQFAELVRYCVGLEHADDTDRLIVEPARDHAAERLLK